MLAAHCPNCGAPTPISLASDELSCVQCSSRSPLPAQVMAQVLQAREVLFRAEPARRQIKKSQLSALRWARVIGWLFVVVLLSATFLLLMPMVALLFASAAALRDADAGTVLGTLLWLVLLPLLAFFVPGGMYAWALRQARQTR